jgi:hypothetical protein
VSGPWSPKHAGGDVIYINAAVGASEWRSGGGPALTDQRASARIAVAAMASASAGVNPACPVPIR